MKRVLRNLKYATIWIGLVYLYLGLVSLASGQIMFEGWWYTPWQYIFEKSGIFR